MVKKKTKTNKKKMSKVDKQEKEINSFIKKNPVKVSKHLIHDVIKLEDRIYIIESKLTAQEIKGFFHKDEKDRFIKTFKKSFGVVIDLALASFLFMVSLYASIGTYEVARISVEDSLAGFLALLVFVITMIVLINLFMEYRNANR